MYIHSFTHSTTMAFQKFVNNLFFGFITSNILVSCFLSPLTMGASLPDSFTKDEIRIIEQFAGDVLTCAEIAGLSIGVVRGHAKFATGLGLADMHTGHSVGKHTIFNLGATSKAFLPYLMEELMKEPEFGKGRITWDSSLKEVLMDSDLEVKAPWADMTLREMLLYQSGSSAADLPTMVGLPPHIDREGLIRRLTFLPDTQEFIKSNHYSNHLYTVVSHVMELISGQRWQDLMKTRVFNPLGMSSATFSPMGMAGGNSDTALPYRFHSWTAPEHFTGFNTTLFDIKPSDPVGSVMVSAEDMTNWLSALLHLLGTKGSNSGNSNPVESVFNEWIPLPADTKTEHMKHESQSARGYGMGWLSSSYRGFQRYKYSGHLYAYSSQVWLFPEAKSAVFLSVNGPNSEKAFRAMDGILFHVSDVLLRNESWVSSSIACCCEDEEDDENDDDDDDDDYYYYDDGKQEGPVEQRRVEYLMPKENYAGKYGNNLVGDLMVENRGGILYLRLGRNLEGELIPGDLDPVLKLHTKGALATTVEWGTDKDFTFLYTISEEGKPYDVVRVKLNNGLAYDFERGKPYKTITMVEKMNAELEKMKASHRKKVVPINEHVDETGTYETLAKADNDVTESQPKHNTTTTEMETTTLPATKPTPTVISTEKITQKVIQKTLVKDDKTEKEETTKSVKKVNEHNKILEDQATIMVKTNKDEKTNENHEILLQRDGNKSHQDETAEHKYMVDKVEYEEKYGGKKSETKASKGRLIRNQGNAEADTSESSAQCLQRSPIFFMSLMACLVFISKRLFLT